MKKFFSIVGRKIQDLPIQRKLVLSFFTLIIFSSLLIGILSFYRSSALLQLKTEQYTKDVLFETSSNIEVKLKEAERITFQIVSNKIIHDAVKASNKFFDNEQQRIQTERSIDSQLRGLISSFPDIAAIQVITNSGISYYINPASIALTTLSMTKAEEQILIQGNGSCYWFDTDAYSRTVCVGRMMNSHENQERIGYVFVYLRESSIFGTFSSTELYRNSELYVVNDEGGIISYRDKTLLGKTNAFTTAEVLRQMTTDSFTISKIAGRNFYVTYRPIQSTSWRIIDFIPTVEYEKEVVWLRNWILLIIFSSCLLSVALSIAISNGISRPVQNLSAMMKKVGDGDFEVYSTYHAKDEIGSLSVHFNEMVEQVRVLIRKVYQEELLKQKAELKSLRMQINPHFLYNTLESINWKARMHGIPEIGVMVKALGDLMRSSIGGDDFVTIEEEMRNINNYLTIQKYRYGQKLQVEIDLDPSILSFEIPKLILQPIVENAIVHGIENKDGNGTIRITGMHCNNIIQLQVFDDGLGIQSNMISSILSDNDSGPSKGHTRIGLKNVDHRIRMYYGDAYGLKITSKPDQGTMVCFRFPIEVNPTELKKLIF